jgi:hypothetical protein
MAAMMYMASASICTPNSLSQEVGLALGAQAGEARLRKVFEDAGFTHVRRAGPDADEPHPRSPRLIWRRCLIPRLLLDAYQWACAGPRFSGTLNPT